MKVSVARVLTCILPLAWGSSADGTCQSCALFTVGKSTSSTSQILGLDLRAKTSCTLGPPVTTAIAALAADPQSNLYAVTNPSGKGQGSGGVLHGVDRRTGSMTPIGNHQFKKIKGIAFRWSDKTLWGWAEGEGLVKFDTATGKAVLSVSSKKKFTGIAWANDGSALYAIDGKRELWAYRDSDKGLKRISKNLPEGATAIEMRSDGHITGVTKPEAAKSTKGGKGKGVKGKGVQGESLTVTTFFVYDLKTLEVVSLDSIQLPGAFLDLSGLAFPRACGIPTPGGKMDIITSVTIEPYPQACIGEDVKVTVEAQHPLSEQGSLDISVNGRPSTPQFLRFTGLPGPRLIEITATTKELYFDFKSMKMDLVTCNAEFVELAAATNPFRYDAIDFEVVNANIFGSASPSYCWDFGDGNPCVNSGSVPHASFVYADLIRGKGRDEALNTIQTTVTLTRPGYQDIIGQIVVPIWNTYAMNKARGVLQLFVETDGLLQQSSNTWTGSYTLINVEDSPMTLKQLRLSRVPCDPDKNPVVDPPLSISLKLPAKQSLTRTVSIPVKQMKDMCAVEVFLSGPGLGGVEVHAAVYLATALPNPVTTELQGDVDLINLLNLVSNQGLIADPLHTSDEELYALGRKQMITFPIATDASSRRNLAPGKCSLAKCDPRTDPDSCLGEPCVPGDPTRPGISCQVTNEWCTAPAYIANALKGDIIAAVGCDGTIGDLLRQLTVPQLYSHVGIVTRNHFEVTHSTSSAGRYKNHLLPKEGKLEGIFGVNEGALRYGWPGVVTQTVAHAFNGEKYQDPSDGKKFKISPFESVPKSCLGVTTRQYPLVVKPPPGSSQAIRKKLIAAADTALRVANTVGSHYRFFAYSNADTIESLKAPSYFSSEYKWLPAKGWAENSIATVCSSFIWHCLKEHGIVLEGQLEERDVKNGAMVDATTADGLYYYPESERLLAARWLFWKTYNDIYDKEYGFEFLLDGADTVANQVVNCFAFDLCDRIVIGDEEYWRNPGPGRAVSPDNIIFHWDSPAQGGVYGYNEPLIYRGGDHRKVSIWQVSEGVGAVAVTVLDRGQVVEGASVEIAGLAGTTNAEGKFQDDKIPAGTYDVVASKLIGGYFKSARVTATVSSGKTTAVTVNLELPPKYIRRVSVKGTMYLFDDERGKDYQDKLWPVDLEARVDVFERNKRLDFKECTGGEVRGELKFEVYLSESDDLTVELRTVSRKGKDGHFWLFEGSAVFGSACDTDDLADWFAWTPAETTVPAGDVVTLKGKASNSGVGGGDYAELDLKVTNEEETFP